MLPDSGYFDVEHCYDCQLSGVAHAHFHRSRGDLSRTPPGGGFSNLFDRTVHGGYVVDFINVGFGALRTGIFNVADVAITVGVLLLVCRNARYRR